MLGLEVQHQPDLPFSLSAIRLHGGPVRAQQVVAHARSLEQVAMPGGEPAGQVPAVRHDPRLVDGRPQPDAVVEGAHDDARVLGEPVRDVPVEPAAEIVQGGGEIPVVQRHHGGEPVREQRVDQAVVEVQAARVDRALPGRQNAAPGDAEAVGVEPELAHQRDIVGEAVVLVAGDVARLAPQGTAGGVGKAVPDARARAVGERRALDLIGGRGRPPEEVAGKPDRLTHSRRDAAWPA